MDEQRIEAYVNLIQELLACPAGEEGTILQANGELMDEGLLLTMEAYAERMQELGQEQTAAWLLQLAEELRKMLGNLPQVSSVVTHQNETELLNFGTQPNLSREELTGYVELIQQLFQAEMEGGAEAVTALLVANHHRLDMNFAAVLQFAASQIISEHPDATEMMVALIENISIRIQKFPLGNIANNQEIAIAGYQLVLQYRPVQTELWAQTQNNLGAAYGDRIRGDKAENLEEAIAAFQQALTVYTSTDFPVQWAMTQNNLGVAYSDRIRGDKGENLEMAIAAYQQALTVRTPADFPVQWATTQNNLGIAYSDRIWGDKGENLEMAIAAYQQALTVYRRADFPTDWAMTQNNLGAAYSDRIRGDKGENLEMAIAAYQQALTVYRRADFPVQWAMTQNNLGAAYRNRIRGDKAENLEMAIAAYQQALTVRTPADFPLQWATTQNNLGAAYSDRIRGDKAENLEEAIAAFQQALTVYTSTDFPVQWAMTQNNLGVAYSDRIRGDKAENLEMAIAAYQQALTVYTSTDFPVQWATTQNNLGAAYSDRIRGDKAENLEEAIASFQQALTVYRRADFPADWAMTQNNLGNAYSDRIRGDKAENLEMAIAAYQQALTVRTAADFPIECLQAGRNLGDLGFNEGRWQLAIQGYTTAVEAVETSRSWSVSDERRQEIVRQAINVYENLIQTYINTHQLDKAIETTERARSKHLVDLMASNDLYADAQIPPEVADYLQQYDHLQARLNALRFPASAASPVASPLAKGGRGGQTLAQHREEIAQLEAEQQRIWQELRRRDPVIASQKQVDALNFAQMQALIDSDTTALLSFYTTDNDTHIFILRQDRAPQLFTCEGEGIEKLQIWILQNWLVSYRDDNGKWHQNMETILSELSQRLHLNDLISQHLAGIEELIVVPHLSLHQIPFAALPVDPPQPPAGKTAKHPSASPFLRGMRGGSIRGESEDSVGETPKKGTSSEKEFPCLVKGGLGGNLTRGIAINPPKSQPQPNRNTHYLSDTFRLRIVPSCQILNFCHQRDKIEGTLVMGIVEDTREDLPFTGYECETLAQTYRVPSDKRLRGKSAKIDPYKTLLQEVQILHSSHHGESDLINPLASVLKLADGDLTLAQLLTWRFRNLADAFISACETHLSRPQLTDDILTIATGFLCAGARSVVSTQWSVEDFASALFALFYYKNRFEGSSRPRALQLAQQRLRNLTGTELEREYKSGLEAYLQLRFAGDKETLAFRQYRLQCRCQEDFPFAHPYFWAGFMSQGLA